MQKSPDSRIFRTLHCRLGYILRFLKGHQISNWVTFRLAPLNKLAEKMKPRDPLVFPNPFMKKFENLKAQGWGDNSINLAVQGWAGPDILSQFWMAVQAPSLGAFYFHIEKAGELLITETSRHVLLLFAVLTHVSWRMFASVLLPPRESVPSPPQCWGQRRGQSLHAVWAGEESSWWLSQWSRISSGCPWPTCPMVTRKWRLKSLYCSLRSFCKCLCHHSGLMKGAIDRILKTEQNKKQTKTTKITKKKSLFLLYRVSFPMVLSRPLPCPHFVLMWTLQGTLY